MKTDDLIDLLARDAPPAASRPNWRMRLTLILVGSFVVAAVMVGVSIGYRADMMINPAPLFAKTAFSGLAAAAALPLATRLMQPGRRLGWRVTAVVIFAGACALATAFALMGAPRAEWFNLWCDGGFPTCILYIPIFSVPTAIGLVWLSRALAPTRLTIAGAAIGAVAGGVSAVAYSLHCPIDSVAYVTTWYTLSIALCAAFGALIGQHILRW